MAIAIKDLLKDLRREDVLEDLLEIAKALKLSTTAWQPGEPVRAVLSMFSGFLADLWNDPIAPALRGAFLDYATGGWLTLTAWVSYGVSRREKTFATSPIVVENRGGGFFTFQPGDLRIRNANGKTFTSITGGTLAPWPGGNAAFPTVAIDFRADEAGSDSSTPTGEIEAYPKAPVAAPVNVYARTNAAPIVGMDEERDEDLRERCRLSTGPLSKAGPKSAYAAVATSTLRPDGSLVDVTRVRVLEPGGCVVSVRLASPTGPAAGNSSTPGTDVYYVNARIQAEVVPAGVTCLVNPAVANAMDVSVRLIVDRAKNVTADEAVADATVALEAFFATAPIGGFRSSDGGPGRIFASEILAIASQSNPAIVLAEFVNPTSDESVAPDQVVVPTISVIATLVTQ